MNVRIKLKFFKEMMNEFITKNKASTLFVKKHLPKKSYQFVMSNIRSKIRKKCHYQDPIFKF